MKLILRQGHLTNAHDSNSPFKLARIERPLAASASWYKICRTRNLLSISQIRGASETLLGAYGYVIRGNWNRQQMAARQDSRRDRRHGNQSQPPYLSRPGRKFHRRRLFRRRPVLHRRADYFFRRLPGHFGWASGPAPESRYR